MGMMRRLLRLPFTLLTLLGLLAVAGWTRSIRRPLRHRHLRTAGFAPRDLAGPGWHRLVTSAFLTHGGEVFGRAVFLTAACVGTAEAKHGSRDAATAFWAAHLAALLAIAGAVEAARAARGRPAIPELPRDVGPSAGYLGALGLVCARLPEPWHRRAAVVGIAALAAAPALPPLSESGREAKLLADLAHLVAFPAGLAAGRLLPVR